MIDCGKIVATLEIRARLSFTGFDWSATDGRLTVYGATRSAAMAEFRREVGDVVSVVFVESQRRRRSASRIMDDATSVEVRR